jgi:hypothetical protein
MLQKNVKMKKFANLAIILPIIMFFLGTISMSSFGQEPSSQNMASNIFNDKTLTIPKAVKSFVILIPNEAHHSPLLPIDKRLINQPYVPQNIVVHPDTNIIWFNGDADHTHNVTLTDENSRKIFNSVLKFNSTSKPYSFNQSGKLIYFEKNADKGDPNFLMTGTITVTGVHGQSNTNNINSDLKHTFDTISVLMVPTKDIKKYTNILDKNNVNIVDQYSFDVYSFNDLSEIREGGADQTLLVLGSNNPLDTTISVLKKITLSLPDPY